MRCAFRVGWGPRAPATAEGFCSVGHQGTRKRASFFLPPAANQSAHLLHSPCVPPAPPPPKCLPLHSTPLPQPPAISVTAPAPFNEGNTGTTSAVFVVTLSPASVGALLGPSSGLAVATAAAVVAVAAAALGNTRKMPRAILNNSKPPHPWTSRARKPMPSSTRSVAPPRGGRTTSLALAMLILVPARPRPRSQST
jgi:hypothetical protein